MCNSFQALDNEYFLKEVLQGDPLQMQSLIKKLRRFGTLESGCNTQVYVQYSPLKKI